MKRIFKTRHFRRWMRKTDRGEDALCMAVAEMNAGLIDADLGGFVVKKRVALPGRGKRGSTRTLLATNKHNRWFFIFGFEKNDRCNINTKELESLQNIASDLLKLDSKQIETLLKNRILQEICHDYKI